MNLREAIEAENLEQVIENLTRDPVSGESVDGWGVPVVFLAARTGNLPIVQYLLSIHEQA